MRRALSFYLRFLFLFGDLLFINLSVIFVLQVKGLQDPLREVTIPLLSIFNLPWLFLLVLFSPYKFSRVSPFVKIVKVQLYFIAIYFLSVLSILFVGDIVYLDSSFIILFFAISLSILLIWRIFYFFLNRNFINKRLNFKNVVIVGSGHLAWEMRKFFRIHPEHGYRFLGYFDQNAKVGDVKYIGELYNFCIYNKVNEIYCCLPYLDNLRVKQLIDFGLSNLIQVKLITDYRGFFGRGISLERYDQIPVLNVAAVPLDDRKNQIVKRIFDIAFSTLVILTILSWLIPIIGILVKLDSNGPLFFKQKRAGKGNRPFNCLKFRTMIVHGPEFKQATKNDPRVTRIGKILRRTSLDELPQFINVFKGQMSIVGPRPHPIKLNEEYITRIEKYMARHYVSPGITGLAQAKGFRGETQTETLMRGRVKLDRFYIENWSFFLDVKIILMTIISLFKGDQKAY